MALIIVALLEKSLIFTLYMGGDDVVLPTPELHRMTKMRSFSGCDLEFERSKSRKYRIVSIPR